MGQNKQLSSVFLIVFMDLLGFSLILPLLPYYAQTFGASPFVVGLIVAVYAAAQMVSAPLLGRLSDRVGRRPVLLISIGGTMISFIVLGFANAIWVIFVARLIDVLTAGNLSVAQAYITDVTDVKNRARGLGMIGAAFGLGFIIGPVLGGVLSQWGYDVPAFLAAALAGINLLLVAFWLPESLTAEKREVLAINGRPPFTLRAMVEGLRRPYVGPLLHTRFFFGLAFSTFQTVFSLYALYRFQLAAANTSYILAYVGVLSAVTQGFVIGRIALRFTDSQLILAATVVMAGGLIGWAFAPSVFFLLVLLIPIALSGGILNTILNSAATKAVMPSEVGGLLGLSSSLESLTRVIAPSVGGFLIGQIGTSAPGIVTGIIMVWLATYVYRFIYKAPQNPTLQPVKVEA